MPLRQADRAIFIFVYFLRPPFSVSHRAPLSGATLRWQIQTCRMPMCRTINKKSNFHRAVLFGSNWAQFIVDTNILYVDTKIIWSARWHSACWRSAHWHSACRGSAPWRSTIPFSVHTRFCVSISETAFLPNDKNRVARFLLVQRTKTGKNVPNHQNVYQITKKYTKSPKSILNHQKYTKSRCGKFRIFYVALRAPNVFVLLKLSLRSYLETSCASQTSFLF
jgi:hypothetical protein